METKGPADEGGTRLDQQGQEGFEHAERVGDTELKKL